MHPRCLPALCVMTLLAVCGEPDATPAPPDEPTQEAPPDEEPPIEEPPAPFESCSSADPAANSSGYPIRSGFRHVTLTALDTRPPSARAALRELLCGRALSLARCTQRRGFIGELTVELRFGPDPEREGEMTMQEVTAAPDAPAQGADTTACMARSLRRLGSELEEGTGTLTLATGEPTPPWGSSPDDAEDDAESD